MSAAAAETAALAAEGEAPVMKRTPCTATTGERSVAIHTSFDRLRESRLSMAGSRSVVGLGGGG